MKKYIATLLLVCMVLGLAACGSSAPAAESTSPAASSASSEKASAAPVVADKTFSFTINGQSIGYDFSLADAKQLFADLESAGYEVTSNTYETGGDFYAGKDDCSVIMLISNNALEFASFDADTSYFREGLKMYESTVEDIVSYHGVADIYYSTDRRDFYGYDNGDGYIYGYYVRNNKIRQGVVSSADAFENLILRDYLEEQPEGALDLSAVGSIASEFKVGDTTLTFANTIDEFAHAFQAAGWSFAIASESNEVYFRGDEETAVIFYDKLNPDYLRGMSYYALDLGLPYGGLGEDATLESIVAIYGNNYKRTAIQKGFNYTFTTEADSLIFCIEDGKLTGVTVVDEQSVTQKKIANRSRTVTLFDVDYALPFAPSELAANGWQIQGDIAPGSYVSATAPDGYSQIDLYIEDNGNGPEVVTVMTLTPSPLFTYMGLTTDISTVDEALEKYDFVGDEEYGNIRTLYYDDDKYSSTLSFYDGVLNDFIVNYYS